MKPEYIGIATVAVMWGSYPLIARAAGGGGIVGTLIMMTTGWLAVAIATAVNGFSSQLALRDTIKLAIAGLLMGIGFIAFNMVASSRRMDASLSIPIIDTAMMIVTVVGALWFFAEPFTIKKAVGLALLLAGIAVLHQP